MSFNILSRKEMTMMLLPAGICIAYTTIVLRQFHTVGTEQKVENSKEKEILRETIIVKLHGVDYLWTTGTNQWRKHMLLRGSYVVLIFNYNIKSDKI